MKNLKAYIIMAIAISIFCLMMWSKYKGYQECISKGFSVNFCASR